MNAKEIYDLLGEDYSLAVTRLVKEDRMIKYFQLFIKDTSFSELETAMEADDMEAAFRAAHTLKGICANICLTNLENMAKSITEDLRDGKDIAHAKEFFPRFRDAYEIVIGILQTSQEV